MTDTSGASARARGTARVWEALGGDPALLSRVRYGGEGALPSALPVMELARAAVAGCSLAAAEFAARRREGGSVPGVRVDDGAVTAAFLSDRLVRVDGAAPTTFAPLSRFWRTADGWVRTHANYPHHRARLLAALGLPDRAGANADAEAEAVAAELAVRRALEVEETVYAAGGLAVAVRSPEEWAAHEQGALSAKHPLLTVERLGGGPRRSPAGPAGPADGTPSPAAGLRVLDLTRVLAGPIATRTLALLGADVLRVDDPGLAESQDVYDDTGLGKRSTLLDLRGSGGDRRVFEELLARADVVVLGYRPGALEQLPGLSPEELAARHPGLVIGRLSAWGRYGPWAARRGFDSLVQAATGIAVTEAAGEDAPGALPTQALDHATGYLLAAGVLRALTDRCEEGGARLVDVALARTAAWLTQGLEKDAPRQEPLPYDPEPWITETDSPRGRLRHALPPVLLDGGPSNWARPSGRWGVDTPEWL
ncbi:CoA transferase [Streptomyces sp. HNM0663]|uniref:CoA transferase n=1 Tax=Streptomyces chengmaiensis TaxID=3040919 RepID=A0ABT6HP45_9ACTN|nr:CoA transferase [Streptomyces chengmaiensis]MDH2390395.1 CoA transferase [Streptomyces chengmaiensis]